MLVTLPAALLLLDYWPLGCVFEAVAAAAEAAVVMDAAPARAVAPSPQPTQIVPVAEFLTYLAHYPLPTPRIVHDLYTLSPLKRGLLKRRM